MKGELVGLARVLILSVLLLSHVCAELPEERPKVGLVLSGGGAKSAAQIAVLKVLDELEIEVDYISGTSMGSFVGALYAIGYSAERIERIFFEQDWDAIMFGNQITRPSLALPEKEIESSFISTFPIVDGRIELPGGLNPGQSLSKLISHYTWPVIHLDDFSKLPTPYLCIGTDIENGEAVVLENGFLADAIRASMTFPSVLSPIEIDDRLLVDGGLARNFPVEDLKMRGMDIIIGVDVGSKLYKKDDLTSVIKVLEQISSYKASVSTQRQRDMCDILITPDIEGFDAGSFGDIHQLYQNGVDAVQHVLPQLQALAADQKKYGDPGTRFIPLENFHPVPIKRVKTEGLVNVSERLLYGKLQIEPNSYLSQEDLELAIDRAFGSQYFERVTYKMERDSTGVDLVVRVQEQTPNQFKVGFHYDNDLHSAVIINGTFRNKLIQGSKLSLTYKLSENISVLGSYEVLTGWKPGIGIGVNYRYQNFEVPLRNSRGSIVALMDYVSHTSNFSLQIISANSHSLGFKLERAYSKVDPIFLAAPPGSFEQSSNPSLTVLNYILFGKVDTYNRSAFPSKGGKVDSEFRWVTDELTMEPSQRHENYHRMYITVDQFFEISESMSWFYGFQIGAIKRIHIKKASPFLSSDPVAYPDIPGDNLFYLGGISSIESNIYPFLGSKFMEFSSKEMTVVKAGIQIEPRKGKFVVVTYNYASLSDQIVYDFYDGASSFERVGLHGYGLTLGMVTPVGPVKYTIMGRSELDELITHVSIGYHF